MKNEALIKQYQSKFQYNLIGKWATKAGTFLMMTDTFEFKADGTGIWIIASGMGEEVINFEWRPKAAFTIELREIDADFAETDDWVPINYDFKLLKTDISEAVILVQEDRDTFYLAQTKIGLLRNLD